MTLEHPASAVRCPYCGEPYLGSHSIPRRYACGRAFLKKDEGNTRVSLECLRKEDEITKTL